MKGLPRSMGRGNPAIQEIIKQSVVVTSVAIEVDGASGVGYGSAVIGDFPEGNILFLGAVCYMELVKDGDASGVVDDFDGDYGIGTTPASDATITGTDVNIIGSTALGEATLGTSPYVRGTNATSAVFDNTDGSLEINLNVLVDDADISADDQGFTASGILHILYSVMGDD